MVAVKSPPVCVRYASETQALCLGSMVKASITPMSGKTSLAVTSSPPVIGVKLQEILLKLAAGIDFGCALIAAISTGFCVCFSVAGNISFRLRSAGMQISLHMPKSIRTMISIGWLGSRGVNSNGNMTPP